MGSPPGYRVSSAVVYAFLLALVCCIATPSYASVNLPLHHWAYDAIERLTVLGIIDYALLTPKPYSRKEAAKMISRAIEQIRADRIGVDGRSKVAEPL